MLVVSDTTPLNYLVLTGCQDVLGILFDRVVIPAAVLRELTAHGAPEAVSNWAQSLPTWAEVRSSSAEPETELGAGEEEAISLASELHADIVLIDEQKARRKAMDHGLRVTGTIGVLILAAERGLLDLDSALAKLQQTSAFISSALLETARAVAKKIREQR